jgi:hypothetical protein
VTSDPVPNFNVEAFEGSGLGPLNTSTTIEQELNMDWAAEENATRTFTSVLNPSHHESEFAEFCSGSLLDGVNDGSDYLFPLNDFFTVPQVDYSSESFSSQWPFLPPGRSSDCYPPPNSATTTAQSALQPEFSNVLLNQDDLLFNISAETGLEVFNMPFIDANLACSTQKMDIPSTPPLTFTSQKFRQKY